MKNRAAAIFLLLLITLSPLQASVADSVVPTIMTIYRGFTWADIRINGTAVRFVTTHLESLWDKDKIPNAANAIDTCNSPEQVSSTQEISALMKVSSTGEGVCFPYDHAGLVATLPTVFTWRVT